MYPITPFSNIPDISIISHKSYTLPTKQISNPSPYFLPVVLHSSLRTIITSPELPLSLLPLWTLRTHSSNIRETNYFPKKYKSDQFSHSLLKTLRYLLIALRLQSKLLTMTSRSCMVGLIPGWKSNLYYTLKKWFLQRNETLVPI